MKYEDLDIKQKNHANGVISKFMDTYIRNNLIWTPEQMYCALFEEIDKQHKDGWYGAKEYVDGKWVSKFYEGNSWITSGDAKEYIINKFTAKYIKHNKLARKKSPLIERARFGLPWDENKYYDINFGLKNGCDFEKTDIVENLTTTPWSIDHVESELSKKYKTTIRDVLSELSQSSIEEKFCDYWLNHYYIKRTNPAIIPEFLGSRNKYYCYKNDNGIYSSSATDEYYRAVNVRFDFAVINFNKQKKLLIELDGHEYHKTKDQRINDSIKRTIATNNGWQLNVITGTQISQDIGSVFETMEDYFMAD